MVRVMSEDDETDEIMRDKALMESIMRSIKQKPKRSFEEFLSELGVEI